MTCLPVTCLIVAGNHAPVFEASRLAALMPGAHAFDPHSSRDVTWDLLDVVHELRPHRIVLCGVMRIDPPLVHELRASGSAVLVIAREVDLGDAPRLVSVMHAATRAAAIGEGVHSAVSALVSGTVLLRADAFARPVAGAAERSSACLLLTAEPDAQVRKTIARLVASHRADAPLLSSLDDLHTAMARAAAVIDLDAAMRRTALVDLSLEARSECAALPRDDANAVAAAGVAHLDELVTALLARPRAPGVPACRGCGAQEFLQEGASR